VNVTILTPIRMFRRWPWRACFASRYRHFCLWQSSMISQSYTTLWKANETQVVLIDVYSGYRSFFDVRSIATQFPDVPLLALGLNETTPGGDLLWPEKDLPATFHAMPRLTWFASRSVMFAAGRLCLSTRNLWWIAAGLVSSRTKFRGTRSKSCLDSAREERGVLEFLGRGFSNKEIA